ncbi:MAG: DUF1499 domain-containing protein [Paracoccaceae bacterium]
MKYLILALLVLVGFGLYVRLAPSDPARWHVDPETAAAPPGGSFRTQVQMQVAPEAALTAFAARALDTPRTKVLAGSAAEGRITFVTRSRLWGFPDYTTVAAEAVPGGSQLTVLARLRFGAGDLGVNRARVEAWVQALQPMQR